MNSDFAMQGPDDGYVCFDCYSKVWQLGSADQSGAPSSKRQKPCRPTSSTSPRVSAASCRLHIHRRRAKKDIINTVVYAIRQGKYTIAFRQLLSAGPAARRAFIATVKQSVARELRRYTGSQHYPVFSGTESVTSFCWSDALNDFCRSTPTLYAAVSSSVPKNLVEANGQLQ